MRVKSHPKPRCDEYVDENVSDKLIVMNNENDRRWMEWSVDGMRWRGSNIQSFDGVSQK